jgi:predicted TIM-barrel fold metal-dependent hydrolase
MYKVISADSHIVEPPHLWKKWLAPEFQKYAPKLVKDAEGGDAWQYGEGVPPAPIGLVAVKRGRKYADPDYKWTGLTIAQTNQGCYYGEVRLKEQDEDGIDAEILYAPVRAITHFMAPGRDDIALAGVQAYNDWLSKEFCAADPRRLIGLAIIPNIGIDAAIAELKRVHAMGMKGCTLAAWPSGGELISADDDPFWAAAQSLDMPVSIHVRLAGKQGMALMKEGGGLGENRATANPLVTMSTTNMVDSPKIVASMVFAGVFDRYPKLRVVLGEVGIGWVPALLESMDDMYVRDRYWTKTSLERQPSSYWQSNFAATFIIDRFGVKNRHDMGVETILWSNDYPHHRCDWLETRRVIEEQMQGVPPAERAAMLAGNTARIYGLVRI